MSGEDGAHLGDGEQREGDGIVQVDNRVILSVGNADMSAPQDGDQSPSS